jgi:uncharacterized membrane protein YdcZ (DUF606 family)
MMISYDGIDYTTWGVGFVMAAVFDSFEDSDFAQSESIARFTLLGGLVGSVLFFARIFR